jgi:hypothetical protein
MAAQPRAPEAEELSTERLHPTPTAAPAPAPGDGAVVELVGRKVGTISDVDPQLAFENAVEAALLPHQLHAIDNIVEIAHLQELTQEKDARIALLVMGIAQWRERAIVESDARRREQQAAHERERDLIRVIHQQMAIVDSAEQSSQGAQARIRELEASIDALELRLQQRSRRWWQRAG